ncbi:MAG: 16S rRNA (adenine(1518)-N(6)/adenine(1519)-N(6))-dimethyltransferase RsmA [Actinomycetota bacterium]
MPRSPRSARASRTSRSPTSGLTPSAVRSLAARHGIRPKKSLGQHFLIEPALARRIAEIAAIGPDDRVLEIGAGLGSLTLALAETNADVVAVELDRSLVSAVQEAVHGRPNVRLVVGDGLRAGWDEMLPEPGGWVMVANLPYNVAVPVVMRALDEEPRIQRFVVMVQREVGERLVARPGDREYAGVSVRVAYRCEAKLIRRVPASVFWPRPSVESVLVSMVRRPPPFEVDEDVLWRVVRESFAQRRKTMRNAVVRLGIPRDGADALLESVGIAPGARAEELDLPAFARLTQALGVSRFVLEPQREGPERPPPAPRRSARPRGRSPGRR